MSAPVAVGFVFRHDTTGGARRRRPARRCEGPIVMPAQLAATDVPGASGPGLERRPGQLSGQIEGRPGAGDE